ncbi:hypothetical protein ACJJIF_02360 [Microbulbifer sp. SSSA002]|uniref:hypothetical protein n=1 Tax=Microbulbifer sp. SSSA002 TaxID=3243376 RepID=UPI0040392C1D
MKYLFLLLFVLAGNVNGAGVGSGAGEITQLYIPKSGNLIRLYFSRDIQNPSGCDNDGGYMVELDDTPGSSRFMSSILAAYTAQKTISFWIDGCTSGIYWGGTWPVIKDIYMN